MYSINFRFIDIERNVKKGSIKVFISYYLKEIVDCFYKFVEIFFFLFVCWDFNRVI